MREGSTSGCNLKSSSDFIAASTASKRMLTPPSGVAFHLPSPYLKELQGPFERVTFFGSAIPGRSGATATYPRWAQAIACSTAALWPPPWRTSIPGCFPGVLGEAMTAKISELSLERKTRLFSETSAGRVFVDATSRRISGGLPSRKGVKGS
jgi:hypothetical protein